VFEYTQQTHKSNSKQNSPNKKTLLKLETKWNSRKKKTYLKIGIEN
jgi:hypothetical protein